MKNSYKLIVLVLLAALFLSACKANLPTPPAATGEGPAATTPMTETAAPEETTETSVGSENGTDAAASTAAAPTAVLTPSPTPDTRLKDENGKMICTVYPPLFPEEISAEEQAIIQKVPAISAEDRQKGSEKAVITILEYSDFQCPYCSLAHAELEKFIAEHPDEVRFIFRAFPLVSIHPNATLATQAAEAAGLQGDSKYWDMYDVLFTKQSDWSKMKEGDFKAWLKQTATDIGLDPAKFEADLVSDEIVTKVQSIISAGAAAGIKGTPTVFINGRPWQGQWDSYTLGIVLDLLKSEDKAHTECPDFVIDQNKQYTATIKTEKGDIVIELFPKTAPEAVNSFVVLAREGFYGGVTFHRVIKDFVAQGGDPSGTGYSGSGFEYREETDPSVKFDKAGMVGIANSSVPNSSGSQFFITLKELPQLDGGYTIMGQVVSGMEVVQQLTERNPDPQNPPTFEGDKMISVTIDEK